jgi:hypothetical protein
MTRRIPSLLPGLLGLAVLAAGGPAFAQPPKPQAPQWAYAFDLSCRKLGEAEFTKDTKKFGVEVFKDVNTNLGVYLSQEGVLGLTGTFDIKPPLKDSKAPDWIAGLDLKARKAGELEFTKAKAHAMEVFHDGNSGNWVYITEKGVVAVARGPRTFSRPPSPKPPVWLHSMDLRCRKAGQKDWDKDKTPIYGLEVYRDANTGNLIYISDTGSIAIVSDVEEPKESPEKGKAPEWLHGLDLQVRKVGEKDFTKKTSKYGVELFRDGNNGCLILLTETGHLAVTPPAKVNFKSPTPNPKDATFTHGLDLSVRQAGEKDFTEKTRAYAVEVFREENVPIVIYVTETGAIAAVPKQ